MRNETKQLDGKTPERVMLFDGNANWGKLRNGNRQGVVGKKPGRLKKKKKDFAGYEKRCTLVSLDRVRSSSLNLLLK